VNRRGAFLAQARSDLAAYDALCRSKSLSPCHQLHYLQMLTEKIARAARMAAGVSNAHEMSHKAFSKLAAILARSDYAAKRLKMDKASYRHFLRRAHDIARDIEQLAPAIGTGPNVEYPWEGRDAAGEMTWYVPADYAFPVYHRLRQADGANLLKLVRILIEDFDAVMGH
jgi:hypothetical protein